MEADDELAAATRLIDKSLTADQPVLDKIYKLETKNMITEARRLLAKLLALRE